MNNEQRPLDRKRLLELADRVFDGTARAEDLQQLEAMLSDAPDARGVYLRYALLHGQLAVTVPAMSAFETVSPQVSSVEPVAFRLQSRWRQLAALTLSIAALILLVVSLWPGEMVVREQQALPSSTYYDNRYLSIETVAMVGANASGPTTLTVAQGATRFASSGGADVLVEGPAVFGVSSRGGGVLFDGSVHARLEKRDSTFSVQTSNLRIVDLGTEFRVAMLDDQHVRVQVLDGEVDVQSRVRLPLYYWNFDDAADGLRDVRASSKSAPIWGRSAARVPGIIGSGAVGLNNTADSFVRVEHGTGDKAGTGAMSCSSGITIEAMLVSRWSGQFLDYDEIFRKEDGIYRVLLSLQNDGNVGHYALPEVATGPCLSFGLHLEQQGYSELDMPLDGRDGRPTLAELTDGSAHHIAATYDSFTGRKAIYIDGKLCFEHSFPVGAMILSGGPAEAEIGNHRGSEPFHGIIDEVAFYDFALTPQEIALHSQNVSLGKTYFGMDAQSLAVTRWQSVTRVTAGTQRVFNKLTGLPTGVAALTDPNRR